VNDVLIGGTGNDTLNGGAGADILTGGGGIDTFISTWDFTQDSATGTIVHDLPPANLNVPGSASADLAQTIAAALTIGDQFAFQGDSQSGTLAMDSTSIAPGKDASATDAMTLDMTASCSSSDLQLTVAATTNGSADSGLTSSVAAKSQPAIGASISNSTQTGTMPQTASASPAAMGPHGSDTFVFAANCGPETIPYTDVIEIDRTVFADIQALLAAAHDDENGSAVIAADSHDTITLKDVTVAQLIEHQGDFYFT
jgi:Ca2+-binding RTX toxin-like protein